jgi:hypothetical protein
MAVGVPSKTIQTNAGKIELVYPNKENVLSVLNQRKQN